MSSTVLEAPPNAEKLLTAEEFYAGGPPANTELVAGKVIHLMPTGFDHGEYAGIIFMHLLAFVRKQGLGRVSVEAGYRLFGDPDFVRAPDVSFLAQARLQGITTSSYIDGPPTLAVEVISPGDEWLEVEEKVRSYFEAGTKVVWLVDPKRRAVIVRRADGAPATYIEGDIVPGGEILPGFELPVQEIFE